MFAPFLPVNPHKQEENEKVSQPLIDLCGMLRSSLSVPQKYKTPGHCGFNSVNLRIHKVAHPYEKSRKCNNNRYPVDNPGKVLFFLSCEKPKGYQDTYSGTVTCKSSVPYLDYLDGMAQVICRFIEEAMPEPGPDYNTERHIDSQTIECGL